MKTLLEIDAGTLEWRDPGFWHFKMNAYYNISKEELSTFFDFIASHSSGRKAPLLIDRSNPYSPDFEIWQSFLVKAPPFISAIVYYAPTASAAMASDFLRSVFLKDWSTVMIFKEMEEAEQWLQRYVESGLST